MSPTAQAIYSTALQRCAIALFLLAVWGLLAAPNVVLASVKHESIQDIRQQAQQFVDSYDFGVNHRVAAKVGQIDTRLRLHRCDKPLDIYFTNTDIRPGRNFLGVRCESGKPWNIYVSALVDMYADVLVSQKPLLRGDSIEEAHVSFETRKLTALRAGYYTDITQLKDMQVTRTVRKGQVITPSLLKPRFLVTRGQAVTLLATIGGISVRMKGKALGDATSNSRVRVRNDSSGRVVEGLVTGQGIVKIPM